MNPLEFARKLVYNAFSITSWFYEKEFNIYKKNDKTPVTLADLSSQIFINSQIRNSYADHGIISEEDATHLKQSIQNRIKKCYNSLESSGIAAFPHSSNLEKLVKYEGDLNSEYLWSVDPIDGTKGYVRGLSYAVGVCLFKNYEPFISAIAVPEYKEHPVAIFSAKRGQGAWCSYDNKEHKPIQVSNQKTLLDAKLTRSLHHIIGWEESFLQLAQINESIQMDGMGKGALVADGTVDIYFRPYPTKYQSIWDVGPIDLLIREAGGYVRDFKGERLEYKGKKCIMSTRGYLATNPLLMSKLLEILQNKELEDKFL